MQTKAEHCGQVLNVSRRHAFVTQNRSEILKATLSSKALETVIGDKVYLEDKNGEWLVSEVQPRENILERSYREETKAVVANLDRLFLLSAVGPLFNTLNIDRTATVAACAGISLTLILNKIDLGVDPLKKSIERYVELNFEVILTSAKFGNGVDLVEELIHNHELKTVALCGLSGVGKSTLLNRIMPEAERKTAEVSSKTGQGKQTTTQPSGFLHQRTGADPIVLIDLPGIQHFGVSHIEKSFLAETFPEIVKYKEHCRFDNCAHKDEQECGVKAAVEEGLIWPSRYESYIHMLLEIEAARRY